MERFFDFENLIFLVLRLGVFCIIFSLLLSLIILAIRLYSGSKRRRADDVFKLWEGIIIQSLDEIPENLPVIEKNDEKSFLFLWNYFQELLLDESKKNLTILAQRLDLINICRWYLRNHDLKAKLLALNALGWLRDEDSWEVIAKLMESRETIFSLTAAKALITINQERSTPLVLSFIAKRNDWSIDQCAELVRRIGAVEIAGDLISEINRTPANRLPKLIRLLDLLLPSQSNKPLKNILVKQEIKNIAGYKDDFEVICACLRVFRDIDDLGTVKKYLFHKSWEVRMHAAVCLGKLGSQKEIRCLSTATADAEWWVRYRAAQALARIPSMTIKKMRNLADRRHDCFSREVILRVVTEWEAAQSCGLSY